MKLFKFIPLALALSLSTPAAAGWEISTSGKSCVAMAGYDGDTHMLVLMNPNGTAFFGVFNPRWKNVVEGRTYKVKAQVDDYGAHEFQADGMEEGFGFSSNFRDEEFIGEFMAGRGVYFEYQGEKVDALKLTGTYAMMIKLADCASKRGVVDPF